MKLWKCPGCGYLISEVQYLAALFDYPCPRCKAHNLSEFNHAPD